MIRKTSFLLCLLFLSVSTGCIAKSDPVWLEPDRIVKNADFTLTCSGKNADPRGSSLYSWHMFLLNGQSPELLLPLKDLGITRVYQEVDASYLTHRTEILQIAVLRLREAGIETAYLTGDRHWLWDGSDHLYKLLDQLSDYNRSCVAGAEISAVALDVESYTLDEWKDDPRGGFLDYIEMMKQVHSYANGLGLSVIQVIPATLDTIDRELFETFISECCDEVSVMNYRKDVSLSSVWNEFQVCTRLGIPVETIFEISPANEKYSVTEENTLFYDGPDALAEASETMHSFYGNGLRLAYHHFDPLYHLLTGGVLVDLYPYCDVSDPDATIMGQPDNPGSLVLKDETGTEICACLYWPNGTGKNSEYCWLAYGIQNGMTYSLLLDSDRYELAEENASISIHLDDEEFRTSESVCLVRK